MHFEMLESCSKALKKLACVSLILGDAGKIASKFHDDDTEGAHSFNGFKSTVMYCMESVVFIIFYLYCQLPFATCLN